MQNVTSTNSKRFKFRTFKKVLFIIVSFNIHRRISVLGLWETETYLLCTELCYHTDVQNLTSPYPLPPKHPGKKARQEPTTNSTNIWHQQQESNPGHIGLHARQMCSRLCTKPTSWSCCGLFTNNLQTEAFVLKDTFSSAPLRKQLWEIIVTTSISEIHVQNANMIKAWKIGNIFPRLARLTTQLFQHITTVKCYEGGIADYHEQWNAFFWREMGNECFFLVKHDLLSTVHVAVKRD